MIEPRNVFPWLEENCNGTAPLTGTDVEAIVAATACAELWLRTRNNPMALAFALCVAEMQPTLQWMAFHVVAYVGDWDHRAQLWEQAQRVTRMMIGNPVIPDHSTFKRANNEPGGAS